MRNLIKKWNDKWIRRMRNFRIHSRLSIYFVLIFVIPILLIGTLLSIHSFSQNRKEAKAMLQASSKQITANISEYIHYHMQLLEGLSNNKELADNLDKYRQSEWDKKSDIEDYIRLIMGNTFGMSQDIDTSELISNDELYFYFPAPITNGDFRSSDILILDTKQVFCYYRQKEILDDEAYYLIFVKGLTNSNEQCIGNIVTALNLEYFKMACKKNVHGYDNEIIITNEDGQIVASSEGADSSSTFTPDAKKYYLVRADISDTNFTVINQISKTTLIRPAVLMMVITISLALIIALIALFVVRIMTKSITTPIIKLISSMEDNHFDQLLEDPGKDEYHELIVGFNEMNKRIVEQVLKTQQLELEKAKLEGLKKEAELSALSQQINPHFLYNALECIYWNGRLEGDTEISDMVNALGKYLRTIINKGKEYITVKQEIESAENYLFLQNKRFNNRIICQWDIEENIQNTRILKLLLQPILEDLLLSNLDYTEDEVHLWIKITQNQQEVCMKIHGEAVAYLFILMEEEKIDLSGITSVDERLKLYYEHKYGVHLNYEDKLIRLTVPIFYQ